MFSKMMLSLCLTSLLAFSVAAKESYKTELIAELSGVPWGLAQLNDETLIYTLRQGEAGLLNLKTQKVISLKGLPEIAARGQGGLLDVAVPADFKDGGWIYFTHSRLAKGKLVKGQAVTVLSRAKLRGEQLGDWIDVLMTQSASSKSIHFGSRITFDDNGHVYFGVGDRGVRDNAQDNNNHAGTIIRLNRDGSIPKDNPFVGNGSVLPEIYSTGHRNPQGLHYDSRSKSLYEVEHGPRGGDEINIIKAGKNYGWPVISYGKEYWAPLAVGEGTKKVGMEQPIKVYTPSIAPGSLVVYRGKAFPEWDGHVLVSALKLTHISRVELNDLGQAVAEIRLLESLGERIRALLVGKSGYVYFSTDSGKIMRLVPKS